MNIKWFIRRTILLPFHPVVFCVWVIAAVFIAVWEVFRDEPDWDFYVKHMVIDNLSTFTPYYKKGFFSKGNP